MPELYVAEQVLPQLIPPTELVIVPQVEVALTIVNVYVGVKLAVTVCAEDIVTVQVPTPEHPPPLQPEKM